MRFTPGNTAAKNKGAVQTGKRPPKGTKITGGIYVPSHYQHLAPQLDAWIQSYGSVVEFIVAMWEEHQA